MPSHGHGRRLNTAPSPASAILKYLSFYIRTSSKRTNVLLLFLTSLKPLSLFDQQADNGCLDISAWQEPTPPYASPFSTHLQPNVAPVAYATEITQRYNRPSAHDIRAYRPVQRIDRRISNDCTTRSSGCKIRQYCRQVKKIASTEEASFRSGVWKKRRPRASEDCRHTARILMQAWEFARRVTTKEASLTWRMLDVPRPPQRLPSRWRSL